MKIDFFFTTYLTESEHCVVEDMIRNACDKKGIIVKYYRKCDPHIPMIRECKVEALPKIAEKILKDIGLEYGNFHASEKKNYEEKDADKTSGLYTPGEIWERFFNRRKEYYQ